MRVSSGDVLCRVFTSDHPLIKEIQALKLKGRSSWPELIKKLAQLVMHEQMIHSLISLPISQPFSEQLFEVVNTKLLGPPVQCSKELHQDFCNACNTINTTTPQPSASMPTNQQTTPLLPVPSASPSQQRLQLPARAHARPLTHGNQLSKVSSQ